MEQHTTLFLFILLAFMLTRGIPFAGSYARSFNQILMHIGRYFSNLNTLLHEDGHALMGLIFGKGVKRIELYTNTEGVAVTSTYAGARGWLPRVIIALAGYPFSSLMTYVFFYFLAGQKYEWLFYGLGAVITFNLFFLVRNRYGVFWLLSIAAILGGIHYADNPQLISYSMMFIGSILLVESVSSSFVIFMLSIKQPDDAGDATSLKRLTLISSRIWGLLFLTQALYITYLIFKLLR
ncbi:M50 family metallopeptidase [Priestia megaterium]|nr:M50 family metallopeptidase [Priestia megaterium]